MRLRQQIGATLVASAVLLAGAAAPAFAQERHIVDRSALQAAVTKKVQDDSANRDAVLTALRRPEAVSMADRLGLTPTQVTEAVGTMSASEVATLAGPARMAVSAPAGGESITISLTTLLLLAILLVLILR